MINFDTQSRVEIESRDSQSCEQLVFDLDGTKIAIEKVSEAIAPWRSSSPVQRRIDNIFRTGHVCLPAELEPFRNLLATWATVPAITFVNAPVAIQIAESLQLTLYSIYIPGKQEAKQTWSKNEIIQIKRILHWHIMPRKHWCQILLYVIFFAPALIDYENSCNQKLF